MERSVVVGEGSLGMRDIRAGEVIEHQDSVRVRILDAFELTKEAADAVR